MRDDELRRALSDANPWWAAAAAVRDPTAWQEVNRTLRDRRQFDLGYRSGILDDIASGPPDGSLVILTGPRRVGKTVTLPGRTTWAAGGFRERRLSTNAPAPWGGPINVTCWPGCGRMSIPMPHRNRCPNCWPA